MGIMECNDLDAGRMKMDVDEIAEAVAKDIFEIGNALGRPIHRIQFMAGKYPDSEIPQGGLAQDALTERLKEILPKYISA
jgi:hypothetical protein